MDTGSNTVALFLFAHQDDEFGVFQAILDELRGGRAVHCAYLTNGNFGGVAPERRNRESLQVLTRLGVPAEHVNFPGCELGIPDGGLPAHLAPCGDWLRRWLRGFANIGAIYVLAWEGGHQDHDALHAVSVTIAGEHGLLERVRQFSLYNTAGCAGPLYRVFQPLARNGPVVQTPILLRNRLRFLRYCTSYRSQTRSWLGLLPFVLLHYLVDGTQQLQPVSLARLREPPHEGPLYYEKRRWFAWTDMRARLGMLGHARADRQE